MRTRSKPVSPGGLVSLDDIPPRPRRATRSASAQPQGPEIAEPAKTRAGKGSRGKKEVTRVKEDEDPAASAHDGPVDKKVGGSKTTPTPTLSLATVKGRLRQARPAWTCQIVRPGRAREILPALLHRMVPKFRSTRRAASPTVSSEQQGQESVPTTISDTADQSRATQSRSAEDGPVPDPVPVPFPSIDSLFVEPVGESDTPSGLTPRRTPSSYSEIARRRQNEAGGQFDKTLYRLNNLLAQNEVDVEASAPTHQQAVTNDVAAPVIADPATPKREHASPSTPATAPARGTDTSSIWSNWVFNHVTRRWTNLWDRFSGPTPEAQPAAENTASPAATPEKANPPTQASPPPQPAQVDSFAPAVQTTRYEPYRRRSSVSMYIPKRKKDSSRSERPVRRGPIAPPLPHPRRRPGIVKRKYDYLATTPYRKEILDQYLKAPLPSQTRPDPARPTPQVSAPQVSTPQVSTPQVSQTAESTTVDSTNLGKGKRKRPIPEVIPNPPGVSYGFDPDYFIIDSDDEEEAERDKARRAAAAAKKAQESTEKNLAQNDDTEDELPAAKRARIPEPHRRRFSTRQAAGNASTTPSNKIQRLPSTDSASLVSPSQRPGFIPNHRQTYQFPDLSPIDSSGLLCDSPETSRPETSRPETSTPQVSTPYVSTANVSTPQVPRAHVSTPQISMPPASMPPASMPTAPPPPVVQSSLTPQIFMPPAYMLPPYSPPESGGIPVTTTDAADDFSPLTRARNKAEQFKPKTPSRLREAHRSSNTSTPLSLFGLNTPAHGDPLTESPLSGSLRSFGSRLKSPSSWLYEMCPNGDLDQLAWPPRATFGFQPPVATQLPRGSYEGIAGEAVAFWQSMLKADK